MMATLALPMVPSRTAVRIRLSTLRCQAESYRRSKVSGVGRQAPRSGGTHGSERVDLLGVLVVVDDLRLRSGAENASCERRWSELSCSTVTELHSLPEV